MQRTENDQPSSKVTVVQKRHEIFQLGIAGVSCGKHKH